MHHQAPYAFSRDLFAGCVGLFVVALVMLVLIPSALYCLTFNSMNLLF